MRDYFLVTVFFLMLAGTASANSQSDRWESARATFEPLIPEDTAIGIVVGVLNNGENEVYAFGNGKYDANTIFEIGSVTKVFTALTLAAMVTDGQLALSNPIQNYLPEGISSPTKDSNDIRLVHLATHTSGLPRMPPNFLRLSLIWQLDNPYKGYTIDMLWDGVAKTTLTSTPGQRYEYSNFGAGLLGQLLAGAGKTGYESLIKDRICGPLGMTNTMVTLSADAKSALAGGHLKTGRKTANWDCASLVAAGGLKSNVRDLMILLNEYIRPTNKKLAKAIELTVVKRHATFGEDGIGLAWHINKTEDREILWHNGGTGGYASFVGMVRSERIGLVVLSNADFFNKITASGFEYLHQLQKARSKDKMKKNEQEHGTKEDVERKTKRQQRPAESRED